MLAKACFWNFILQVLNHGSSVANNIFDIMQTLSANHKALFACTTWAIWKKGMMLSGEMKLPQELWCATVVYR